MFWLQQQYAVLKPTIRRYVAANSYTRGILWCWK